MKHPIRTTCLAVAGIFIAGFGYTGFGYVSAAETGQPGMMRSAHAPHRAMHDPVAMTQERMDKLNAKLKLNPSQQDAWKTFSAAMVGHAQARAQEMEKCAPGAREKLEDLATPDKMTQMAARMRSGADQMSKLAGDTKIFYDQLGPEQKTIFDLYAKNAWHNRKHDRMHDRMH
jgi:hypothetical protein